MSLTIQPPDSDSVTYRSSKTLDALGSETELKCVCRRSILATVIMAVADPGSSWEGASTPKVGTLTYYFANFLPKTA